MSEELTLSNLTKETVTAVKQKFAIHAESIDASITAERKYPDAPSRLAKIFHMSDYAWGELTATNKKKYLSFACGFIEGYNHLVREVNTKKNDDATRDKIRLRAKDPTHKDPATGVTDIAQACFNLDFWLQRYRQMNNEIHKMTPQESSKALTSLLSAIATYCNTELKDWLPQGNECFVTWDAIIDGGADPDADE